MYVFDEMKLIEIFCKVDDFCQNFERFQAHQSQQLLAIGKGTRGPSAGLSHSETMTILIFYHLSGFKCFKYYYKRLILGLMKSYFPQAPSYGRFISCLSRTGMLLWGFIQIGFPARKSGIYYIDSTKLPVCDIHRASSNKVFRDIAKKGKTSTGWFFGLKLHLIVNELGEIVAFQITSGNVADNNHQLLRKLLTGLKGKCFGDKGYLSKIAEEFIEAGLQLFTKVKKKMKNKLIKLRDKQLLNARTLIETIYDLLKHLFNIDHTRHRNPDNALTHLMAGLCAYQFLEQKPSIYKNKQAIELIPKIS